ncbi:MAG: right-handed parallel beta-helix repeat-containing protein [Candidatus Lokiarchaeota archaeon]|nr:right-handed parallel beta-helix repeat-containing protein [Candidatus Lokiarchaeota archaeon]
MNLKTKLSLSFIFSLLLLPMLFNFINPSDFTSSHTQFNTDNTPKSSGYWTMGPLHIDDNGGGDYTWGQAESNDWCSGDGSLLTPYLLENITIDACGSESGILIEDSNGKYFTIRNCTVMNSGTNLMANAGIKLLTSSNGTVVENNCLNNVKSGIMLAYGNYNFITNNYIYNSSGVGIRIYQSDHNEVLDNNITGGDITTEGIMIDTTSEFNVILENDISNQGTGIRIANTATHNTIVNNWLMNNANYGILINPGCNNNTIKLNEIQNSLYGLCITGDGNAFYRNILINNTQNAEDWGNYNQWDNGTIGNFWDDYGGADANDDGIGDTPYAIAYGSNPDNFPIWDDGDDINPTLTSTSPTPGSTFGNDAPTFNITIYDVNLDQAWYIINSTSIKYFFTPTNGVNVGNIDETAWDALVQGSLIISFFVNDTAGNQETIDVDVNKDLAPIITLVEPLGGSIFAEDAPMFNITLSDVNFDQAWYTINSGTTKYFFNPQNGLNHIPINQTAWTGLSEGSVMISFFVNDTGGNINNLHVTIDKDLPPSQNPPPAIPFGNYYILFMGIGIISLLIIVSRKRKLIHS